MKLIYAACVLAVFASAQTETVQVPDFAKSSMKTHEQAEEKLIANALKGDLSQIASDLPMTPRMVPAMRWYTRLLVAV